MADQHWRVSPPNSGRGPPTGVTNGQPQHAMDGVVQPLGSNGRPKFYSGSAVALPHARNGNGRAASPPLAPPPGSDQGVALGVPRPMGPGASFPSVSSRSRHAVGPQSTGVGMPPHTTPREPSRIAHVSSGTPGFGSGPPSHGLASYGLVPPSYGSGSPSYGSGPPRSGDHGEQRHGGAPLTPVVTAAGSGPLSGTRSYPQPPTSGAFAKPPAGPPTAFQPPTPPAGGRSNNGNSTGQNGNSRNGHASVYASPPTSLLQPPPPVGPPSSAGSNGGFGSGPTFNGDGSGGQAYGGTTSALAGGMGVRGGGMGVGRGMGVPPTPMSMYGSQRPPPLSSGAAPVQFQQPYTSQPYSNGGMLGPAVTSRPKIDPQQIPRPIVDSERITYYTCTPPRVMSPPAPSSNYIAVDEGNCSPRFMRSTMAQLPITADAVSACKIPMAVVVQPMAHVGPYEDPVPVVDFGEGGPLRCEKCRAYINSYASYVHNGEKWVCNFCKHEGAVPQTYQCPLDGAGLRRDRLQRPELCRGSVDFVVPKSVYCLRPEQEPIFVFCVDISPRALETGFAEACFKAVEAALDAVPGGERARVGLMTFDRSLNVYRFDSEGAVSQTVVAVDTEDPYAPLPFRDWILPTKSYRSGIAGVMEAIPGLLKGEGRSQAAGVGKCCACGPALRAMADCLETVGGRVFLMSQSPSDTGAGAMNTGREELALYGGDKEFHMYQPAKTKGVGGTAATWASAEFYQLLAKDCAVRQICVDLMLWSGQDKNREFHDVATVGAVARMTGGRVSYLRGRDAGSAETAQHLREQLSLSLRDHADSASETVLKVRCTAGFACTQRLGPGVENMPGELELAVVTPHHAIVCRLEHDGRKLEEGRLVFIQAALLYTSTSGQRRVRCHTLGLPVTGHLMSIFKCTDVETVSAVLARQSVSRALNNTLTLKALHTQMDEQMLAMLYSYRNKCASDAPDSQLILPETLRLLPLFTLCAHKMLALRLNAEGSAPDVRADERAARLLAAHSLSIVDMIKVLYPSLYSVHDMPPDVGDSAPPSPSRSRSYGEKENGDPHLAEGEGEGEGWCRVRPGVDVPVALPPTSEKLSSQGVFLLDAGEELVLYVGRGVGAEVMRELFGMDVPPAGGALGSGYGIASGELRLVEEEGYEQARRVRNVAAHLRRRCFVHKPLSIVVANSGVPEEGRFVSLMVEDKTKQGTSYIDQLCQLHRQIQARMPKS